MQTTKKQFDTFKKLCKKWIIDLGLVNWQFHYELGKTDIGLVATAEWIYSNKLAIITLNDQCDIILDDETLNKIAFHEVCHVFLSCYQYLIDNNLSKHEHIDPINHDIIRTLENLLFKDD